MSGTPLSDESSGDPQNEQKLTPLSCPGAPGRLADKLRGIHFIIFFLKMMCRERDGFLYSVIRNGMAFRFCFLFLYYFSSGEPLISGCITSLK